MLVDISQKRIDEEKLITEVQGFEVVHGQTAYLFMNKETFEALIDCYGGELYFHPAESTSGVVSYYTGRRVYEDERLNFGQVEIR